MFGLIHAHDDSQIMLGKIVDMTDYITHFEVEIEYDEYHQDVKKPEKMRTRFIIRNIEKDEREHKYAEAFRKRVCAGEFQIGSDVIFYARFGDILHKMGRAYSIKEYGELDFGKGNGKYALIGDVKKSLLKKTKTNKPYLQIQLYIGIEANMPREAIVNIFWEERALFDVMRELTINKKVCFKCKGEPFITKNSVCYEAVSYRAL